MSEVSVFVQDDGWFQAGCNVFPKDRQLCVVIHKYGNQTPGIISLEKLIGCIVRMIIFLMSLKNGNWTALNVRKNGIRVLRHLILSAVGSRLDFLQMITKDF